MSQNSSRRKDLLVALALLGIAMTFYFATLAPTVLWGDDAFYQRAALDGSLRRDAGYHWLWLAMARLFLHIPLGNLALRVNMVSAFAAAVTVPVLYLSIRETNTMRIAAVAAALSFALSHTFWTHAVRAEVYTVFTMMAAIQLWLWFSWKQDRSWPLMAAALLGGLTLLGHQLAVLMAPALCFLIWRQRKWLSKRQWILGISLFIVGLLPLIAIVQGRIKGAHFVDRIWRYFTHYGISFENSFLDFSIDTLTSDAVMWIGLLGLQFIGVAGLLGVWGLIKGKRFSTVWWTVLIFFLTTALFAFSYRVPDRYVFFLPSYLAFVFFVAWGWQDISQTKIKQSWAQAAMLILVIAVPVSTYYALPRILAAADTNPLGIRSLPGREPNTFFLWPAKNGYYGAEQYAYDALTSLPPDGILVADHTPHETLRYLHSVRGVRSDVRLVQIEGRNSLARPLEKLSGEPLYFADNDPAYYNFGSLPCSQLEPFGVIYRLNCDKP
jgi:hypothetical protein